MATKHGTCKACGGHKGLKCRGLCFTCHANPEVREKFGVVPGSKRGLGIGGTGGEPPQPTKAKVGSAEKMAVMQARLEAGLSLCHPLDNPEIVEREPAYSGTDGSPLSREQRKKKLAYNKLWHQRRRENGR